MMRSRNLQHAALRALIREYIITGIKLPTSPTTNIGDNEASQAYKAAKEIVLAIVAIKGMIFVLDNKDEIIAFAENAARAAGDIYDIITKENFNKVRSRTAQLILEETENVFNTKYGKIETAKVDRSVLENIDAAGKKNYIVEPAARGVSDIDQYKAALKPTVADVARVIGDLVRIVEDSTKSFPSNFSSFSSKITLKPVTAEDIDKDEQPIINKATTDAVAVAIFNKVKNQMQSLIKRLKDNIEKEVNLDDDQKKEFEDAVDDFAKEIADEIEKVKGRDAADILVN